MHHYHKLIRDKVPEQYAKVGKILRYHDAESDGEYWEALIHRLQKSLDDVVHQATPESVAEMMEIMDAICNFKKIDCKEVKAIKKRTQETEGGFGKRYILEESPDNQGSGIIETT